MIRLGSLDPAISRARRRQLLRAGFLGAAALAATELAGAVAPFLKVTRVTGLGTRVIAGPGADVLARFATTNDRPILFPQGRFFLLHPPGGIVAAFRKCTHLGCAVPFNTAEDRFHCPCHQSLYDKRTALVTGGPAPRPLGLFHIGEENGSLVVDSNPLNVIDRHGNRWDPSVLEVLD